MIKEKKQGSLIIISGTTCAGKGAVIELLLQRNKNLSLSISYTSRGMRDGEVNGKNYYFVTKEEFERLHEDFKRKASEFEEAQKKQEGMIKELFKNGVISAARLKTMQESSELKEIDRHTLCSMVKAITVFENKRLEVEFYYMNQYRIMQEVNKKAKEHKTNKRPEERSA